MDPPDFEPLGERVHPSLFTSLLGRLYFTWMTPLIQVASERPIDVDDLYPLPHSSSAKALRDAFDVARMANSGKPLWHTFHSVLLRKFWFAGFLRLCRVIWYIQIHK